MIFTVVMFNSNSKLLRNDHFDFYDHILHTIYSGMILYETHVLAVDLNSRVFK